jgi:hypothetical protein
LTTASTLIDPLRPRVLFVGNDASSAQIAAGLLRRLTGDRISVTTAAIRPAASGGRSDELLVAMGLDPADEQRLSTRALHTADRVVSLGSGLDVARLPGPRYEEWDLTQGDLIARVHALSDELTAATAPSTGAAMLGRLRNLLKADRHR